MQGQSSYKIHLNTMCNGELSDPLCDSVNRDMTLVRLVTFQPLIDLNVTDVKFRCPANMVNQPKGSLD